jgi:type VI secretion system ImpM family protein
VSARLFGKLPAHGDFVARGLDAAERARLDEWLSASLATARERLGDGFDAAYDSAPPWRFTDNGVAGALAPSQDAAARRFPVLLLVDGAPELAAACEALLYHAIVERLTADEVIARTAELAPADEPVAAGWWPAGAEELAVVDRESPALLAAMLTTLERTA